MSNLLSQIPNSYGTLISMDDRLNTTIFQKVKSIIYGIEEFLSGRIFLKCHEK